MDPGFIPTLDVMVFAEDRAAELHAVSALLDPPDAAADTHRRPARQDKRLLRRRTGSSVTWRWRTRKPIPREILAKLSTRSRRDNRRATILRARASARGGLETEAWHAKRFHMTKIFGLRLPWRAQDRAEKSSVRAARETCVVHDASYLRCIQLCGDAALLMSVLEHTTDEGLALRAKLRPGRELCCTLHQVDAWPAGAIAPVRMLLANASYSCAAPRRTVPRLQLLPHLFSSLPPLPHLLSDCRGRRDVWIFVHYAAADTALAALQQTVIAATEAAEAHEEAEEDGPAGLPMEGGHAAVSVCYRPMVRLQLRGPQSTALVRRALTVHEPPPAGSNGAGRVASGGSSGTSSSGTSGMGSGGAHAGPANGSTITAARAWEAIGSMASPASLPPRVVLGLEIDAPTPQRHPTKPTSWIKCAAPSTGLKPPAGVAQRATARAAAGAAGAAGAADAKTGAASAPVGQAALLLRRLLCAWPANLAQSPLLRDSATAYGGTNATQTPEPTAGRRAAGAPRRRPPLPLILVQEPPAAASDVGVASGLRGSFGTGWDIIAPEGSGRALWQARTARAPAPPTNRTPHDPLLTPRPAPPFSGPHLGWWARHRPG